jgi:hypothetical protein
MNVPLAVAPPIEDNTSEADGTSDASLGTLKKMFYSRRRQHHVKSTFSHSATSNSDQDTVAEPKLEEPEELPTFAAEATPEEVEVMPVVPKVGDATMRLYQHQHDRPLGSIVENWPFILYQFCNSRCL